MATKRRGPGEGTISLRKDGRWAATITTGYDEAGKRKRRAFYGHSRKEVADKMAAVLQDMKKGIAVDPLKLTLGTFLDDWLENTVRVTTKPRTHEGYKYLVQKYIKPALGMVQLQKLSPQQVQHFLNSLSSRGLSTRTVQFIRAVLRRALGHALKWGMVPRNVGTLVDPPKLIQREAKALSCDDIQAFLKATETDRLHALYTVTLALGLRRGEVLGLMWSDVDLESGKLTVQRSLQRIGGKLQFQEPKTKSSHRTVVLPKIVAQALSTHRVRQLSERMKAGPRWRENGLIFASTIGTPIQPRNLDRAFQETVKRANLEGLHFHDLRHTTCTLLLSQGVGLKMVSELLGHRDIAMTLRVYTHVMNPDRQACADQMDALLAG